MIEEQFNENKATLACYFESKINSAIWFNQYEFLLWYFDRSMWSWNKSIEIEK